MVQTFSCDWLSVFRRKSEPEAVALEAWKDMKMYVKHFLPGRLAIGQEEVDAISFQPGPPNCSREPLRYSEQMRPYTRIEICQVIRVREWNNQ